MTKTCWASAKKGQFLSQPQIIKTNVGGLGLNWEENQLNRIYFFLRDRN